MVKIYYAYSYQAKEYCGKAESILSPDRYEHYKRLKKEDDKLDCLAVGLIINKVFGDPSLVYKDEKGCPRLKNGEFISISHSGGVCAVAVADNAVGLDIQTHSERDYLSLGRIVFCKEELEYLTKCGDTENSFYKLWCLKESYMKAKGLGFYLSPKSFRFDIAGGGIRLVSDDDKKWFFSCFDLSGLTAALCCDGTDEYTLVNIPLT